MRTQSSVSFFSARPSCFFAPTSCCPAAPTSRAGTGLSDQVSLYSSSATTKGLKDNVEEKLGMVGGEKFTKDVAHPEQLEQFQNSQTATSIESDDEDLPPMGIHALPHPIWDDYSIHSVRITHRKPKTRIDKLALASVKTLRAGFDLVSGYTWRPHTEKIWLNRIIFLETVAGVPGMVAAMVRHLHSLRRMRRDHGWIHTLLEEAENERMHLMTAMQLKKPTALFRWSVVGTQAIFVGWFSIAYLISPRFCHRFVGYLEEEAVVTYSNLLKDIDDKNGAMKHWATQPAPSVAITYWQLEPEAMMRDVVLAIRADEAHHRLVNHTLGSMRPDQYNPYKPGK